MINNSNTRIQMERGVVMEERNDKNELIEQRYKNLEKLKEAMSEAGFG